MRTDTKPAKDLKLSDLWIRIWTRQKQLQPVGEGPPLKAWKNCLRRSPLMWFQYVYPTSCITQHYWLWQEKPVKFIFLEKPAVRTPEEADEVRTLYGELPIRVQVNYTRRFVPEIRRIREAIRSGNYGAFLTGTGYYGKGLLHNGSHMVDLLQFLVGEVGNVAKISEITDFYDHDPSVSALLTMHSGGDFYLCHIDSRIFHIFELDLTFENKRIRICELGTIIEEYSVGDNRLFEGYRTLNKDAEFSTQHSKAMYHAIANIRNNLDRNEPLVCTLEESLETVKTCSRIMRGRAE